jgi:endonuclease/exonuclease/phosphatase family metal-dependent hydrolase
VVAQANHFAVWITLSGVVAFVLGLLFWIPKLLWLWLAPAPVLFLLWFGPNFLPNPEPEANGIAFTAATYNIQDELGDTSQIYANVAEMNADIVAFQEMSPELKTRIENEQLYPYLVTGFRESELLGIASRFPVVENEMFDGQFLRAVVEINGRRMVVYNLHAPNADINVSQRTFNDTVLNDSIKKVLEQVKQESEPVLLLCDCNITPRTRQ